MLTRYTRDRSSNDASTPVSRFPKLGTSLAFPSEFGKISKVDLERDMEGMGVRYGSGPERLSLDDGQDLSRMITVTVETKVV